MTRLIVALALITVVAGESLPEGWKSAVDPTSGKSYFYNRITGKSQWENPAARADKIEKIEGDRLIAFNKAYRELNKGSPSPLLQKKEWDSAVDPKSGKTYHYNRITGVSQWEKPKQADAKVARSNAFNNAYRQMTDKSWPSLRSEKKTEEKKAQVKEEDGIRYRFYVLNLDRRPDRMTEFKKTMKPSMVGNTCRISAADASKLSEEDFKQGGRFEGRLSDLSRLHSHHRGTWSELNEGAVGCYLSHSMAWDQIVKDDVDVGIVIEDDSSDWSGSFEQDLRRVIINPNLPEEKKNWDIILMSHCADGMGDNANTVYGGTACTGAMAVSRQGAKNLLEKALPMTSAIDNQVNLNLGYQPEGNPAVKVWRTIPKMGQQRSLGSDVQTDNYWFRELKAPSLIQMNMTKTAPTATFFQRKGRTMDERDIPDC